MADVGIVMPVYKQHTGLLQKAIRSVLRQSYRDYKLVIVIDGITSTVLRTVRRETRQDPRVQIIAYRKNKGTAHALNTGFRVFADDPQILYLTWVSSDNIYYPAFLSTLHQHLTNGPDNVGLVYSNSRYITNKGRPAYTLARLRQQREWRAQPKENLLDICFIGASFLYRKAVALAVGEYRLTPVEDYDYWLRLAECCELAYVPVDLVDYRLRSTYSMSRKLATSLPMYRKKRYISQLIRLEARMRRNIPSETTVIILWNHASQLTIKRLEKLFEQTYFNFTCTVIDQTSGATFLPVLKKVPDPRIKHLHMPNVSTQEAVETVLTQVNSPFLLFYGNGPHISKHFLTGLVNPFRSLYPRLLAIHYAEPDHNQQYATHHLIDPHYQNIQTNQYTLVCRSVRLQAEPKNQHLYYVPRLIRPF